VATAGHDGAPSTTAKCLADIGAHDEPSACGFLLSTGPNHRWGNTVNDSQKRKGDASLFWTTSNGVPRCRQEHRQPPHVAERSKGSAETHARM
jgi:hypothetical protein